MIIISICFYCCNFTWIKILQTIHQFNLIVLMRTKTWLMWISNLTNGYMYWSWHQQLFLFSHESEATLSEFLIISKFYFNIKVGTWLVFLFYNIEKDLHCTMYILFSCCENQEVNSLFAIIKHHDFLCVKKCA